MPGSLSRFLSLVIIVAVLGATGLAAQPSASTLAKTSVLQSDDGPPEPPDVEDDPTPEPTEEVDPPAPPDDPDDPEEGGDDDPGGSSGSTGVDGNSYTDAEYGWSISWEDPWQLTGDPAENGILILENGTSSVLFTVMIGIDDVQDCIADQIISLVDGEATSSVSRLMQGGEHVRGGNRTAAYAAYRYNFKTENATIKLVGYFDCRRLPRGQDTLLTNLMVVQGEYPNEIDGVLALLEGLTIEE